MLTEDCQQALQTVRDVKWEFRVNEDEPPNIVFGDGCVDLQLSMQSVVIDQHVWELPFSVSAQFRVATDADLPKYELSDIDVLNKNDDPQHLQRFLLEKFDVFFAEVMQASDELLRICREMNLKPENERYTEDRVLKSLHKTNQGRPPSWGKLNGGLNLVFTHGWKVSRDIEYESAVKVSYEYLRNRAKTFPLRNCEPDELVNTAICNAKKQVPWFKHQDPGMSYSFFNQYLFYAYSEQVDDIERERKVTKERKIAKPLATVETPSINLERRELQERVQAALNVLSEEDRALAKLILAEGISVAEIARESREQYTKIYNRLRKIKAKLRRFLAAND